MRKTYLISDTHLNHDKIATWCKRPEDFTEQLNKNIQHIVKPTDTLIHLGDVGIGNKHEYMKTVRSWPGKKILVRGNHDNESLGWYVDNGFDFACDGMIYRKMWLTHRPWLTPLPEGTLFNIHGHLHNVWDGFLPDDPKKRQDEFVVAVLTGRLLFPWQRLFAVEYTGYAPVEFDKFVARPDSYQATGPSAATKKRMRLAEEDAQKCSACIPEPGL
jgi:calcineurin-like phosphoesterase family protein